MPPPGQTEVKAPAFVDAYYCHARDRYRIVIWFFYELNDWHGIQTHQGDWEHISLIVESDELKARGAPRHVYFAQHDSGKLVPFGDLTLSDCTHPVIYVDKDGHATKPWVDTPDKHPYLWSTWESLRLLVREPWRDFAGAWGAVGNTSFTTGPLGPLYKRTKDHIQVKMWGGRLYTRSFK